MKKITKKEFITLHNNNKLKVLCGVIFKSKEEVLEKIKGIKNIEEYEKTLSDYSNIYGEEKTIYRDNNIILIESITRLMSDKHKTTLTTAYIVK